MLARQQQPPPIPLVYQLYLNRAAASGPCGQQCCCGSPFPRPRCSTPCQATGIASTHCNEPSLRPKRTSVTLCMFCACRHSSARRRCAVQCASMPATAQVMNDTLMEVHEAAGSIILAGNYTPWSLAAIYASQHTHTFSWHCPAQPTQDACKRIAEAAPAERSSCQG
jgi:hypothetical protein